MSSTALVVYLLEHETSRELGLALAAVLGLAVEGLPGREVVITLPA